MLRLFRVVVYILLVVVSITVADAAMAWAMPAWITALGTTTTAFTRLVLGFSYLLGLIFVIRAIMSLKLASQNNMMGGGDNSHLKGALVNLFIGVVFVYLPTFISLMVETFYSQSSLLAYKNLGFASSDFDELIDVLGKIIKLIGVIAFVRGWLLLARLGGHGGAQPGTVPKAIMHIVGGLLAINIMGTVTLFKSMVGY